MKVKPDLGFWKLWDLSFGFFGVQIAYALQSANVSRIFTTIGADPHELSYFWILPPLMGLLVQPVVGTLSDRTWTRAGRRLPYLILGATMAVIVMCLLPNAGSFNFNVSGAILFGLIALMMLDTSINMAMQPFKMLVGDMVNEKQKGLAYSIQSFLCNAGSVVGYIFPICLAWLGMKNTAPGGVVPPTVVWSFYIGAAILMACVIYSLIKIREWPPMLYNEYNGGAETPAAKREEKRGLIHLLVHAPATFWTVGLVQFFCWFAFLFLWTYAPNTVAHNAFDTPSIKTITGLSDGDQLYNAKYLLVNDTVTIMAHGEAVVAGAEINGKMYPAKNVVINGNDTIVNDGHVCRDAQGNPKIALNEPLSERVGGVTIDGEKIDGDVTLNVRDYLSQINGPAKLTTASIVARDKSTGKITTEDAKEHNIQDLGKCEFETKTVLNAASPQYNDAGNWVGLLYAVQALGSVLWAVLLPRFRSRKLSYSLSLALGAAGFILLGIIADKWLLFIPFVMIGCAWAAMLAWPFTILTNSLKGGNIGAYLGLFNCSICIPQIVAALAGGWILTLMSNPGELAPEYMMMIIAGISMAIGTLAVFVIREGKGKSVKEEKLVEAAVESENI